MAILYRIKPENLVFITEIDVADNGVGPLRGGIIAPSRDL